MPRPITWELLVRTVLNWSVLDSKELYQDVLEQSIRDRDVPHRNP